MKVSKSVSAKLLATENITVLQENVHTASFDVKNRVLTLPLWADVDTYTEDHLIGHEVGHALYTPLEGWHDAVCDKGGNYKSFLNVVEDARIEKLIQRKYPGLRPLFIKSYRKLLAEGFFGGTVDAINEMGLIDRINTYFKCGMSAGIKFSATEKQWLSRIEKLETWDQVVATTDELFEFCKQQMEEQQQAEEEANANADPEDLEDDEGDEEDSDNFGFSDDDDYDEEEFDDMQSSAADTDGDGEEQSEEMGEQGAAEGEESGDDAEGESEVPASTRTGGFGSSFNPNEPSSKTDDSLRQSIDNMVDVDGLREVINFNLHAPDYRKHVVSHKTILDDVNGIKPLITVGDAEVDDWRQDEYHLKSWSEHRADFAPAVNAVSSYFYTKFLRNNKKSINHMVKEFEMKKQASEFARASTAKTGVIDTIKMNNYKLTDDIFKKVTVLPEGKNHAFVMFLDMSGSMADHMFETVEQTLLLTNFCRQIGVPFRVYGFSDRWSKNSWSHCGARTARPDYYVAKGVALLELFTNEMSKADMAKMGGTMLMHYARIFSSRERSNRRTVGLREETGYNLHHCSMYQSPFDLGGTPLDSAIAIGIPLINDFRASTRADIMNVVFLTDGASHELECPVSFRNNNYGTRIMPTITSPWSNKTYKSRQLGTRMTTQTELLLEMMKDETGANMIGYFITQQSKQCFMSNYTYQIGSQIGWDTKDNLWKQARADGYLPVKVAGYDDFYLIGDKSLKIEDSKMQEVNGETTKAKLRSAFKKAQVGGKKSRKMLNDVVARVA